MKVEAGKFYTTRNGLKVRIYYTDGEGKYPVHGSILVGGKWRMEIWTWTLGGDYGCGYANSDYSLVSEWKEPKKLVKYYAYLHEGTVCMDIDQKYAARFTRLPHLDCEVEENKNAE